MTLSEEKNAESQVKGLIYSIFEAGKNKDFAFLNRVHAGDKGFSKFDDNPPFRRQDSNETAMFEEAALVNISDYAYDIEDLKIDIFDNIAITTFYLSYTGIFVNNYTFEGRNVAARSRVTMVLHKRERGWVIVHEHRSRFPET